MEQIERTLNPYTTVVCGMNCIMYLYILYIIHKTYTTEWIVRNTWRSICSQPTTSWLLSDSGYMVYMCIYEQCSE
jgi:hypothetical protein